MYMYMDWNLYTTTEIPSLYVHVYNIEFYLAHTLFSNLLSLSRFGDASSFLPSFIQEASTSSDGWMARKYSD